MQLPDDFIRYTREMMGEERFQRYLNSFNEPVPVSIRMNPMKSGHTMPDAGWTVVDGEPVPWCTAGYYLPRRPQFTMDPLLHAGLYYVQEAASMFLDTVLRQHLPHHAVEALDLCAAPGGKSTLMAAALPQGSVLYTNEPVRQRASILAENMAKWGFPGCTVTCNYPQDYRASKLKFDVILCDLPCSGEGMFRRDAATIGEWSAQHVEQCWQLQRNIVADAWECLREDGLLVYSTCTFNTKENEENIRWLLTALKGVEALSVDTRPEWNITGSLLPGFTVPVYRFIPGITRSEGLFVCVLHKRQSSGASDRGKKAKQAKRKARPLNVINHPFSLQTGEASVSLTYPQAISFLRGEALRLPEDTPRGIVEVSFMGHALGTVKNIGTRANNQYPKEWRIRTTHTPTEYEAILRHT